MSEYPKLVGTELEPVAPYLPPDAHVLVIEKDGRIVGCWAAIRYVHVEGLWLAPDMRHRPGAARRLWLGMRQLAHAMGASVVLTGALSDDVRGLLDHVGATKLPGDHYAVPLGEA